MGDRDGRECDGTTQEDNLHDGLRTNHKDRAASPLKVGHRGKKKTFIHEPAKQESMLSGLHTRSTCAHECMRSERSHNTRVEGRCVCALGSILRDILRMLILKRAEYFSVVIEIKLLQLGICASIRRPEVTVPPVGPNGRATSMCSCSRRKRKAYTDLDVFFFTPMTYYILTNASVHMSRHEDISTTTTTPNVTEQPPPKKKKIIPAIETVAEVEYGRVVNSGQKCGSGRKAEGKRGEKSRSRASLC